MEFRPWAKSYHLGNNENFPLDGTYYFGIRIKKNDSGQMMRVEMTDTIKIFYKKLKEWIGLDPRLMTMIVEKLVDLKINYISRDDLPEMIRPKGMMPVDGNMLGKRQRNDS